MATIRNPILTGFNPDPSICKVGKDYYIAVSTFEWFPGVQIYRSEDLLNWKLVVRPLSRVSQLDLTGIPDSGGVWAPCLTYAGKHFYLIYSNVKSWRGLYKDSPNYLVTAPSIEGPWSDPVYLNSSGFDPSLFHDDDGRKWVVNQFWDQRPENHSFAGIVLQEYDPEKQCLVGPVRNIFAGTELQATEGPHLYKRNHWYYLVTAEGGTGRGHNVTIARSRSIEGPYELHPSHPFLTSKGTSCYLQKAGHASWVPIDDLTYALVHLCGRPDPETRRCILGRETALQLIQWGDDDWPHLLGDTLNNPSSCIILDYDVEKESPQFEPRDDFNTGKLGFQYQSLRIPSDSSWCSLDERPGWLMLSGQESNASRHRQSVIGRRIQALPTRVETTLDFDPCDHQQMAGLAAYYNVDTHFYLYVSMAESGRVLRLQIHDRGSGCEILESPIPLPAAGFVSLAFTIDPKFVQFEYSVDGESFIPIKACLDASKLSDEYCDSFTGAFATLMCQDLSGRKAKAFFDYLELSNSLDD